MKAFTDQLLAFWTELDASRRFQLVMTLVVTLVVLIGVGIWSAQPHWVAVTDVVSPKEAQAAAAALHQESIRFKRDEAGRLMVDRADEGAASAALRTVGLTKSMRDAEQIPMGMSPDAMQWAFLRTKEGDLAAAINKIDGVISSQVNIVEMADDAIVASEVEPARASVVVEMMPGKTLSTDQVRSITNTVAGAVAGMTADRVMVIDDNGALLTKELGGGTDASAALLNSLVEYQDMQERRIVRKVQSALGPLFGFKGGFSVTALVELDLTSKQTTSNRIDGRGQVPASEQIAETSRTSEEPTGVPGVDANLPERPADNASTTEENTSETTTNFMYPTVEEVMQRPAGGVERMSVAVQVDSTRIAETVAAAGVTDGELREQIEQTVRAAVGLDESRKDTVTVSYVPFQPVDFTETEESSVTTAFVAQMVLGALPYLLGLVATFLAFSNVIRPLMTRITAAKPPKTLEEQIADLEAQAGGDETLTIRLRKLIDNFRPVDSAELSGLVSQQPGAAAKVLKQWKRYG